jgi:hypothetical protein
LLSTQHAYGIPSLPGITNVIFAPSVHARGTCLPKTIVVDVIIATRSEIDTIAMMVFLAHDELIN